MAQDNGCQPPSGGVSDQVGNGVANVVSHLQHFHRTDGSSTSDVAIYESSRRNGTGRVPSHASTQHSCNGVNGQVNSTTASRGREVRNEHKEAVHLQEPPLANVSVGNRSSNSLSRATVRSALTNQSDADLLNQLPTHSRANLQPSMIPPSRHSGGVRRPTDSGLVRGNLVFGNLRGRYLEDPRFTMGFDRHVTGEFEGRFDINGTVDFYGTFNGVHKQLPQVKFAGTVNGKFDGIFCGDKIRRERNDIFLFGGLFTGQFRGEIVGTLSSSSIDVVSNKPKGKVEDDDDKSKLKSEIEVIELDDDEDDHQPNDREVGDNNTAPTNRDTSIEDGSVVDDVNHGHDNDGNDNSAEYKIHREEDENDNIDDSQLDLAVLGESDNEADMANQQQHKQSQRRASARIPELKMKRASKRSLQEELSNPRDNLPGLRTIFVSCYDCAMEFDTFALLDQHLSQDQLERFLCFGNGCNESFTTARLLKNHTEENHLKGTNKKLVCRIVDCAKKIKNQKHGRVHLETHITGQFVCTLCTCHCEMINLAAARDRFKQTKHSSTNCGKTAMCGLTFDQFTAWKNHQRHHHKKWNYETVLRCKQDKQCALTRSTMFRHLRTEHNVTDNTKGFTSIHGDSLKTLEKYTDTLTEHQVNLELASVAPFDPFRPSTSGTQTTTRRSLGNQIFRPLYGFDDDNDDNDDDDYISNQSVPSTNPRPPTRAQGNQSRPFAAASNRRNKCFFKDVTKE